MTRHRLEEEQEEAHETRSFYAAKAQFITVDDKGVTTPFETEIRIGDPGQALIYIEPRLGDAIRSAVAQQVGLANTQDLKKIPMVFRHTSRHFSHGTVPYPRVEISQDLPRQPGTKDDTSPATMWTSLKWHALTLDGSEEDEFEQLSRQSGEDWKELLEMLSRT
ncbi:hypothetical protein CPLU01_07173 [Colletotrichum plurivorum]|uniref:Uncharacterized protein n=1 Tax=Colletotrichum plurivorum TaxID=2175906 RepID=A0A8H6NFK8_9PEZI|nr:hypothetical protein CPLU01_07173 [Colletotrichum plurivorum]